MPFTLNESSETDLTDATTPAPRTSKAPKIYSLRQVTSAIRRALENATGGRLWLVRAEVVKCSGQLGTQHVYLDLVDQAVGGPQAKMRGMIWARTGASILQELGEDAKDVLSPGREIVFSARVAFHESHGLSLSIEKIELQHMLGELERRRQATIKRLQTSGAMALNGRLPIPSLPQRIALVGSKGTSGYRDFATKIAASGYRMSIQPFHATVQGADAPKALMAALRDAEAWSPDVIVLLRGGGSKIDLACFDDFALCQTISDLNRPVFTGIGHESDLSVADMCANEMFKTPTDVAVGILNIFDAAAGQVQELKRGVAQLAQSGLNQHRTSLRTLGGAVSSHTRQAMLRKKAQVHHFGQQIQQGSTSAVLSYRQELTRTSAEVQRLAQATFAQRSQSLLNLQATIDAYHPDRTLERGFAIVRSADQTVLNTPAQTQPGDVLHIEFRHHLLHVQATSWEAKPNGPAQNLSPKAASSKVQN